MLLPGNGVFIYKGSVEDSATAEISRSQVWQWLRHGAVLEDNGQTITKPLVIQFMNDLLVELRGQAATATERGLLTIASQVK